MLNVSRDGFFCIDKAREQLGYAPRIGSAEGLPAILPDVRRTFDRIAGSLGAAGTARS